MAQNRNDRKSFKEFANAMKKIRDRRPTKEQIEELNKVLGEQGLLEEPMTVKEHLLRRITEELKTILTNKPSKDDIKEITDFIQAELDGLVTNVEVIDDFSNQTTSEESELSFSEGIEQDKDVMKMIDDMDDDEEKSHDEVDGFDMVGVPLMNNEDKLKKFKDSDYTARITPKPIMLTEDEAERFIEVLENPPLPNEALTKVMDKHGYLKRMTNDELMAFMALIMCADPTPLTEEGDKLMKDFADREAVRRGYKDWIEAYFEMK